MTFTDDDLKRLKEAVIILGDTRQTFCADFKIPDLVARLEAAEKMEKPLQAFLDFQGEHKRDTNCMDGMERTKYQVAEEYLDAWRKAAGK